MIKKLICLIWGHKILARAFTGETMDQTNYNGEPVKVGLYKWKRYDFCLRCGKDFVRPNDQA